MPQTLFGNATPPSYITGLGTYSIGNRFYSDSDGTIIGIRYYKDSSMGGGYAGGVYDILGNLLVSLIFSGETASGWQQMLFSSPLSITANTNYIVAICFTDVYDYWAASWPINSGNLHTNATPVSLYTAGSSLVFPTTVGTVNWPVDVLFLLPFIPTASQANASSQSNTTLDAGSTSAIAAAIDSASMAGQFSCEITYDWTTEESIIVKSYMQSKGYTVNIIPSYSGGYILSLDWSR